MRFFLSFVSVAAMAAILSTCAPAYGQQGHDGHSQFHQDFYRHWKEPDSDRSCCNARVTVDGRETGDCEPTQAELRRDKDGAVQWFAYIRQTGEYVRVDDGRIVKERNPNTFDAHVCWTPRRGIICFVPPDTGG